MATIQAEKVLARRRVEQTADVPRVVFDLSEFLFIIQYMRSKSEREEGEKNKTRVFVPPLHSASMSRGQKEKNEVAKELELAPETLALSPRKTSWTLLRKGVVVGVLLRSVEEHFENGRSP